MIPISVTIENWGPVKGRQVFEFPQEPGLYFLWGRNEVQPRLGSNGAGKSRLWEAICWAFFGKTSRGMKAGDVANWDQGKGASVSFQYLVDGELPCTITRTWGPNSWTWVDWEGHEFDLAKDETNPALADLRLTFTSFLHTVFMAQTEDRFLDLKADKKAELFSDVMGLDRWLTHSQRAGKLAADADSKARVLERELAKLEGQLHQVDDRPMADLSEAWEAKRLQSLADLEKTYANELRARSQAKHSLEKATQAEDDGRLRLQKSQAPGAGFFDQQLKINEIEARHEVTKQETILSALTGHLEFLKTHDHCPTCDQDIDPKNKRTQAGKTAAAITHAKGDLNHARGQLTEAQEAIQLRQAEEAASVLKMERAADDLALLVRATKEARRQAEIVERRLDDLEAEAEGLQSAKNPYVDLLAESSARASALQKDIRQTTRLLDDANSQYRMFSFWVKGFKEIRLSQIGEALIQLEVEVNSEVSALGLVGWELRFEVDRETKGGSIQRGFNVTVLSPHNPKPVPWESWSGGEAQRLRIAAQCGLANLIRGNTGASLNLEVWDEPTNGMSPLGITDLLASLEARAKTEGRQIWIVDHHSLSFGGFSGTAGVIKTKAGSQFDLEGLYISPQEAKPNAQSRRNANAVRDPPPDDIRRRATTPRTQTERTKS